MNRDELAELMAEPPYGHGHGRERFETAGWHPLETAQQDFPSVKSYAEPRKHGTAYTYVKLRCRCVECRRWRAVKGNPVK